jgi:hypothetical protein
MENYMKNASKCNAYDTITIPFKVYRYALRVVYTKHVLEYHIACSVHGLDNLVWETSDMRLFSQYTRHTNMTQCEQTTHLTV